VGWWSWLQGGELLSDLEGDDVGAGENGRADEGLAGVVHLALMRGDGLVAHLHHLPARGGEFGQGGLVADDAAVLGEAVELRGAATLLVGLDLLDAVEVVMAKFVPEIAPRLTMVTVS
jgi:hypothetical protein